jgi:hypothetical protein
LRRACQARIIFTSTRAKTLAPRLAIAPEHGKDYKQWRDARLPTDRFLVSNDSGGNTP